MKATSIDIKPILRVVAEPYDNHGNYYRHILLDKCTYQTLDTDTFNNSH